MYVISCHVAVGYLGGVSRLRRRAGAQPVQRPLLLRQLRLQHRVQP